MFGEGTPDIGALWLFPCWMVWFIICGPEGGSGVDWTAWHVFAVEWNASAMTFFVDDVAYETKTPAEAVFPSAPQYVILNTAIAWYFMPGDEAVYPATTRVDWVKVWSWG